MEKQDLNNLSQTTKGYAQSVWWLSNIIAGVFLVICGLMIYFKFVWWDFMYGVGFLCWYFIPKYLNRVVMRKGLGYVKEKTKDTEFSLEQVVFIVLPWVIFMLLFIVKNWDKNIIYPVMFLGTGVVAIIIGLINRKKTFFYSALYSGVFLIICGLILLLVSPIKHIFYAHEMAPWGIIMTLIGLVFILSGIINYFQYKKIVQKVKGTN
ncbi:MAG: hypothetical protein PHX21_02940 [bacterium]|nr:hypothetical protein [bacterium]